MPNKVAKWGHSLAVRLPLQIVRQTGLKAGDTVTISAGQDGSVIIIPTRPQHDLDDLLGAITPDNLHGEADWGQAQGGEVW